MALTIKKYTDESVEKMLDIASKWVLSEGKVIMEEIESISQRIKGKADKDFIYYILKSEGNIYGYCALCKPEKDMERYVQTSNPIELVNVFLDPNERGKGYGVKMLNEVFEIAKADGYSEVLWNSGPRYEKTAWDFYDKLVGPREFAENNYYGEGSHAPIWRKTLV